MTFLAVLLAVAVAAGPSGHPRRAGIDVSNAARAKAGLLPRKPARARSEVRRYPTVRAPAPTYLAEPEPLGDGGPAVDGDAAATPDVVTAGGDASTPAAPELVVARGPVEARRLPDAPASEGAGAAPARDAAPEELGAVRAKASGVVVDVTISLRFDR